MMIWVNFPEILVYLCLLPNSSSIRLAKVKIIIEVVFAFCNSSEVYSRCLKVKIIIMSLNMCTKYADSALHDIFLWKSTFTSVVCS